MSSFLVNAPVSDGRPGARKPVTGAGAGFPLSGLVSPAHPTIIDERKTALVEFDREGMPPMSVGLRLWRCFLDTEADFATELAACQANLILLMRRAG